ncbi:sensor histidine kinase [Paenibacillus sp. 2TAB23]|uniref:cache domain-containing sensor histidine kinase n=1 Tax=Paenibacillus sp. 2TAB23 TaxID=3233004 RepID=UPI003F96B548
MYRKLRQSLQWKLVLMITAIITLVITVIGTVNYSKSIDAIDSDVTRFSNQILTQANFNLSRYVEDNEHFFQTLGTSGEFRNWSTALNANAYHIYRNYKNMESKYIEPFIAYHPELLAIVFYSNNGYQSVYRNPDNSKYMLTTGYAMEKEPWFGHLPFEGEATRSVKVNTSYVNSSGASVKLPVLTYLQQFNYGSDSSYLQLDISLNSTQAILDAVKLGDTGSTFIVDENGSVITAHEQDQVGNSIDDMLQSVLSQNDSGSYYMKSTKQMIVYQIIPQTGWKIVSLIPYRELAKSVFSIRIWTTIMTIIGIVIASLLVYLVATSITRRMKELRKTIGMTRLGRLDVRVNMKGSDEVAELGAAYNHLLDRIEESIQQLAESRIVQQHAILSALQSQINSHFLFNAMESINSMANLARHKGIMDTTVALSNMLRYTSNYQQTLVTLEEELDHVSDYLHIIRILYRDDVQFRMETEEEVKGARSLKAIIQPFVENSIKHGFETTAEPMMIRISARREGEAYVCIEIEDNGSGITEEKLRELQGALALEREAQEFMQLSRIGVLNVHYRLRAFYKDSRSGVSLSVTDEGKTRITLMFPYFTKDVYPL